MAISGDFFGLDSATLTSLKTKFITCLEAIAVAGQEYEIAGRQFTRADLPEVRQTIAELQAAIERAGGTRRITATVAAFKSPY